MTDATAPASRIGTCRAASASALQAGHSHATSAFHAATTKGTTR